ncbi:hypothetical protein BOX15_Mlig019918g2, partial [Macrostomum lignano]
KTASCFIIAQRYSTKKSAMALLPFRFPALHFLLTALAISSLAPPAESAAAWSYRWRNLNASDSGGGCSATLQTVDLADHFREALIDIVVYQALGEIANKTEQPEACGLQRNILDYVSNQLDTKSVCLNPHSTAELQTILQYLQLAQPSGGWPPAVSAVLSKINYRDALSERGFFSSASVPVLTAAPLEVELVSATYQFIVRRGWSYVGLLWEAEPGSTRLSQQLQSQWRSDGRVCFPLLLSFTSRNVTEAARSLKNFVYVSRRLPRFTVAFVGSGAAFLRLWDLVSGSDSAFADTEKRYHLVLVGAAFSSFHRMSDTPRRRNLALGTVFIFPGILDPDVATDELRLLFSNITSDPASMGRFSELRDTHSRLNSLKQSTSSLCTWSDPNSLCYLLALRYDFHALSLAPLLADGVPSLSAIIDIQRLRQKSVTLSSLKTNLTILDSFVRAGFTSYSMERGLEHSTRGFWQPIAKIYQSQLSGTSYSLVKLGEMIVRQAGTIAQAYELDVSGRSRFYELTSGNPDIFPKETNSTTSECPASCPECVSESEKQFIQFKEGDIYLGVLVPVFYRGSDVFDCTDGSFRKKSVGGYEFAMAFKFVVDMVDALSQGSPMPQGFNTSQVDQNFLRGVRDLLERVHDGRTKKLRWGYVVLDTCYSPSCTVRRLGSLLDGTLASAPGFNFTKVVGFVGALSSTQTMASSQLLKMYNLPLISYGSTSTALSNIGQYPFVIRTVSSDTAIIEGMVQMLRHLNADYISVVYASSAYGMSLRDEMNAIASENGICIAKLISYDCGDDKSCKRGLIISLKSVKARYVAFLSSLQDLISLLNYPEAEMDIDYLTLLTTESVGVSDAAFVDKKNVGLGTLSLQLVSSPAPAFAAFVNYSLTKLPPNPNNISRWDRLYFEDAQQCYLPGSFQRNPAFSQACLQSLVERHPITEVESRSPFVIDATATLVLGTLTAMTYLCQVTTPEPACPAFFAGDFGGMLQRANLVMYGSVASSDPRPQGFSGSYNGVAWSYRKVFDKRMGRTPFSLWQYRKVGSGDYRFVQIGLFDGDSSSSFTETAEQLQSMERSFSATAGDSCRTKAQCSVRDTQCANRPKTAHSPTPNPRDGNVTNKDSGGGGVSLGFLGLLIFPGFLLGFLPICVYNLCIKLRSSDDNQSDVSASAEYANNESFRSGKANVGGDYPWCSNGNGSGSMA